MQFSELLTFLFTYYEGDEWLLHRAREAMAKKRQKWMTQVKCSCQKEIVALFSLKK